jgi:hypothetical protein
LERAKGIEPSWPAWKVGDAETGLPDVWSVRISAVAVCVAAAPCADVTPGGLT